VGDKGKILKTSDGGHTWTRQKAPATRWLFDVKFVSDRQGWVVGAVGKILHTTSGGATWRTQSSGTTQALYAVDFVDARHGWAAGKRGIVLGASNGGRTWRHLAILSSGDVADISMADRRHGWVVGPGFTIRHTTDSGRTWKWQRRNYHDSEYWLSAVRCVDASHCWIAGPGSYSIEENGIEATVDGGVTWRAQLKSDGGMDTDVSYPCVALDLSNLSNGWSVGEYCIYHTSDGSAWTRQRTGVKFTKLTGVTAVSATTAWAVGYFWNENNAAYQPVILHTTDGGATWVHQGTRR
jgi:photosystem II stability/assembly factor-like uncharacterized protein